MKLKIFFLGGSLFSLEMVSLAHLERTFLPLAMFLRMYFFSSAREPSLPQVANLARLQSPTLFLCSVRAIRLCPRKGNKALSPFVPGAWLDVPWMVKGSQLASLICMTEVASFWEAVCIWTV